jgi:hypothetical protein
MKKTHLSLLVLAMLSFRFAAGQNLLSNPSFELGNAGFTSSYLYSPGSDANQGDYAVLHNPYPWNSGAFSMIDHTSGSGLMLVLKGSSVSNGRGLDRDGVRAIEYRLFVFRVGSELGQTE